MDPELPRWIRGLFRLAALRASQAELGDTLEEYAGGRRSVFWLAREIFSTLRTHRSVITIHDRRPDMMANLWSDIRYAVRTFGRSPAFATAAVVPIALGIGINTGVFSILNSVAWRPLPAPDATELVSVHQELRGVTERRVHGGRSMFSIPEYRVYRENATTLSGVMAYSRPWTATLGGESPQEVDGVLVTCNYFDVLRLPPAVGSGFPPEGCETPGAPPVVVLSHALWTRTFGADAEIVGKTITLNGRSVEVTGVASEGFHGVDLTRVSFFAPTPVQAVLQPDRAFHEDAHLSWLTLIGRRARGTGIAQVRSELALIASQIDRQQPGRTTSVVVAPATSLSMPAARRDTFTAAAVVLAAFGLVLLIACANVANLLLARAAGRRREIALRLSVGASRGRIIRQLLTESAVIAVAGGCAGFFLAWWSFQALLVWLLSALPGTIPPLSLDARPNLTVFWFALGLAMVTTFVFGLVPALQASRQDVLTALKEDDATARRTGGWVRGALVGTQVAVCMILLIATGLLGRALHAAQTVEPGFVYRGVSVVSLALRGPDYDDQRIAAFHRQMMDRIASLPGVGAVAQVSKVPLSPGRHQNMFRLPDENAWHSVDVNSVSPSYFSLLEIPIVRGRTFGPEEIADTSRAVIVTDAMARRFWPGEDPVGRTLVMGLGPGQEIAREIVGVAGDAQVGQIADTSSSYIYLPANPGDRRLALLLRSPVTAVPLDADIRAIAREIDRGPVVRVAPLEENLEFWQTLSRLTAGLSGAVSLLALALASVGVYGVVAYVVSRRRREMGIRMALGASGPDVQRLMLRQTLRPVLAGAIAGVLGAAAASQALQAVLFGISPLDPIAFVAAPLLLLGVAGAAAFLPTRRAVRAAPMVTLRYE